MSPEDFKQECNDINAILNMSDKEVYQSEIKRLKGELESLTLFADYVIDVAEGDDSLSPEEISELSIESGIAVLDYDGYRKTYK